MNKLIYNTHRAFTTKTCHISLHYSSHFPSVDIIQHSNHKFKSSFFHFTTFVFDFHTFAQIHVLSSLSFATLAFHHFSWMFIIWTRVSNFYLIELWIIFFFACRVLPPKIDNNFLVADTPLKAIDSITYVNYLRQNIIMLSLSVTWEKEKNNIKWNNCSSKKGASIVGR